MADSGEKGKFSADISKDVIEAALNSVKKRTGEAVEPPAAPDATTEEVVVEGASGAEPAADAELRKELEETKAQLELSLQKGREMMEKVKDSHERMLRAAADLENFKKRAQREKEEVQRFGIERLLKDFLPVLDNLDRALEHGKSGIDLESFSKGVAMTRKLFEDTLAKHGVKGFSSVGQPFDPRFHEAMSQVETSELPPQHVVFEAVRGFTLNDRLIRPALVTVSQAPAAKGEGAPSSPPGDAAAPAPDAGPATGE